MPFLFVAVFVWYCLQFGLVLGASCTAALSTLRASALLRFLVQDLLAFAGLLKLSLEEETGDLQIWKALFGAVHALRRVAKRLAVTQLLRVAIDHLKMRRMCHLPLIKELTDLMISLLLYFHDYLSLRSNLADNAFSTDSDFLLLLYPLEFHLLSFFF